MKLMRYGPAGAEKPALVDAEGKVRDLSDHVDDIAGEVLTPSGLQRIAALDPASLPVVADPGRTGPCVGKVGKFICIGLNYADHAAETGAADPEGADPLHEGDERHLRSERQRHHSAQFDEDRLGSRTRRGDRQGGALRFRGRGDGSRRRLLRHQRRVGARVPGRTRRAVGEGQVGRHLRADRAVAGDEGRGRRPAGTSSCGSVSTARCARTARPGR